MKKKSLLLISIFFLALFYRLYSLQISHPFWIDEYSSAIQAINLLSYFEKGNFLIYNEHNNYITHLLIAISFKFFGITETFARLPFVVIGSIVPVLIYLLTYKLFNKKAALFSALLVTFSYFEITWSVQARGYVLQQALTTSLFLYYISYINKNKLSIQKILVLLFIALLGIFTHNMFVLPIFSLIFHFIIFNFKYFLSLIKKPLVILPTIFLLCLFIFFSSIYKVFTNDLFNLFNNLWYYHSFLWREYSLIIFLSLIGIFSNLKNKLSEVSLLTIFIFVQLIFITFFFGHYMTKYTFPIFHLILLFSGLGIFFISDSLSKLYKIKKLNLFIGLILTLFILINGNKFVIQPKNFYSVNNDMREIAIIDYNRVYKLIKNKIKFNKEEVAIIDTWPDRTKWYMGINIQNTYYFRWINSGFRKNTSYYLNSENDKIINSINIKLIGELSDLQKAMTKYPKGFIWIDDTSLPADVIEYAKNNFYQELYLESYEPELLENPYSIWPGTLYSWGFETDNPFYSKPTQNIIE